MTWTREFCKFVEPRLRCDTKNLLARRGRELYRYNSENKQYCIVKDAAQYLPVELIGLMRCIIESVSWRK